MKLRSEVAAVSRHLSRTRRSIRTTVEATLRDQGGLSGAQIARAFELAVEDPEEFDLQQVFDRPADRKESSGDRSR